MVSGAFGCAVPVVANDLLAKGIFTTPKQKTPPRQEILGPCILGKDPDRSWSWRIGRGAGEDVAIYIQGCRV